MKVKKEHIKYIVIDKNTDEVSIHRFKSSISRKTGISERTLCRGIPYENDFYKVLTVGSVEI